MSATRNDFPPGTHVRAWTRDVTPRSALGTGVVVEPEGPLAASGLVLVAMPAHEGFPAMRWWYEPAQLTRE